MGTLDDRLKELGLTRDNLAELDDLAAGEREAVWDANMDPDPELPRITSYIFMGRGLDDRPHQIGTEDDLVMSARMRARLEEQGHVPRLESAWIVPIAAWHEIERERRAAYDAWKERIAAWRASKPSFAQYDAKARAAWARNNPPPWSYLDPFHAGGPAWDLIGERFPGAFKELVSDGTCVGAVECMKCLTHTNELDAESADTAGIFGSVDKLYDLRRDDHVAQDATASNVDARLALLERRFRWTWAVIVGAAVISMIANILLLTR